MKTRIENGITIISTGDPTGGIKNKNGHRGIHRDSRSGKLRAEINYKRKKYMLGLSNDIDELVAIRKEADIHVANGDFLDWLKDMRIKRNDKKS